jgi:hypothetical protein
MNTAQRAAPRAAPATDAAGRPVTRYDASEPAWLRSVAFVGAAAVAGFGLVGLALAVAGWYRPLAAFPLGALATLGLIALARPALAPSRCSRAGHVLAAVGLALVVATSAWHAGNVSEHVLIDRDGGSYANTGRWIASHGDLDAEPRVGPFAGEASLGVSSFAVYEEPGGRIEFQFAHLLPVLLAEAHRVGGDTLMFRLPAMLSGVALLAFFVLAWRVARSPVHAVAATAALALLVPQVSFSRDTYSEIPTQLLVFTALWLLTTGDGRLPAAGVTGAAGVLLGAVQAVRIDALVFAPGLPLLVFVAWRRAAPGARAAVLHRAGALLAGMVPGLVVGLTDLRLRSGTYFSDLSGEVRAVVVAILAVAATTVVVAVLAGRVRAARVRPRLLASAAGAAVLVAGLGAWWLRPEVQRTRGGVPGIVPGLQALEGLTVDPTRRYSEFSVRWMGWYVGPVALLAAVLGAALLVRAVVLGRRLHVLPAALVLGPASAFYLWRPSAFPDHVWVMRRYLVTALPAIVLLAVGLSAVLMQARAAGAGRVAARGAAVVVAIAAVGFPAWTTLPVASMTEQRGYLGVVRDACAILGRDAAVVVLRSEAGIAHQWFPQALRSWCGAQVATSRGDPDPAVLARLAAGWAAEGRTLWVASDDAATIRGVYPEAVPVKTRQGVNRRFLERTLMHRPDDYLVQHFTLALARVPSG